MSTDQKKMLHLLLDHTGSIHVFTSNLPLSRSHSALFRSVSASSAPPLPQAAHMAAAAAPKEPAGQRLVASAVIPCPMSMITARVGTRIDPKAMSIVLYMFPPPRGLRTIILSQSRPMKKVDFTNQKHGGPLLTTKLGGPCAIYSGGVEPSETFISHSAPGQGESSQPQSPAKPQGHRTCGATCNEATKKRSTCAKSNEASKRLIFVDMLNRFLDRC